MLLFVLPVPDLETGVILKLCCLSLAAACHRKHCKPFLAKCNLHWAQLHWVARATAKKCDPRLSTCEHPSTPMSTSTVTSGCLNLKSVSRANVHSAVGVLILGRLRPSIKAPQPNLWPPTSVTALKKSSSYTGNLQSSQRTQRRKQGKVGNF